MSNETNFIILQEGRIIPSRDGKNHYQVVSKKRIGTNGISYEAIWQEQNNKRIFIKTPKVTREQLSDVSIYQKLDYAFRQVFKRAQRIPKVEGVAEFIAVECFAEEDAGGYPVYIPFTIHQFIDGDSLYDFAAKQKEKSDFCYCKSATEWFRMATELVTIVKEFHNAQVAHGNISPDNVHIDKTGKLVIVDFAEACLVDEEWRKVSVGASHESPPEDPYTAPERLHATSGWDFAADIYSIGGVLYYLCCGDDPSVIRKQAVDQTTDKAEEIESLKKAILEGIKARNPTLLKENPGIARIIDKCRRRNTNDRYPYPESILSHIDIFNNVESLNLDSFRKSAADAVSRIQVALQNLVQGSNVPFSRILYPELLMLEKHIGGMIKGNHEIIGDREDLIDSLLRYLSLLRAGNAYYTLTTPEFWSASNLGINGRFLTMNMVMAMRGVAIRRIFLLTEEETREPHVLRILEAHNEAVEQCSVKLNCDVNGCPIDDNDGYFTGYVIESAAKREELITAGYHTGLLKFNTGYLSINFMTRPDNKTIGKVRFWASKDEEMLLREFKSRKPSPISNILPKKNEHTKESYASEKNDP